MTGHYADHKTEKCKRPECRKDWSDHRIGVGLIYGIIFAIIIGSLGAIAGDMIPMAGLGAGLILLFSIIFGLIAGFICGALYALFIMSLPASLAR